MIAFPVPACVLMASLVPPAKTDVPKEPTATIASKPAFVNMVPRASMTPVPASVHPASVAHTVKLVGLKYSSFMSVDITVLNIHYTLCT